jgi:CoA:oxalate CoA-transferase
MSGDGATRRGMLAGVRVLEFAALIAGPSCARFLADHGAEVIKIERYPDGDISRHSFGAGGSGRGPMFLQHNAGKKGLCIDLKQPEGREAALDLAAEADVVIEAFTPGVMDRLGLGYKALRERNPRIVLCSVSGFGQTGPNAGRPGYAHVAHALSGWLAIQFLHRDPPERPRGPGIAIGDTTTGLTAFGAVCAALFNRERTGQGEHIDIALFDSLFGSNDGTIQAELQGLNRPVWYHPVHATRDGFLTANVGPDFRAWSNVCKAMGRPELLQDPRFSTQQSVSEHLDEAGALVSEWMAELDCTEAEAILEAHHIPCARVLRVEEATEQPQVAERGLTVEVVDPVFGPMRVLSSAYKYKDSQSGVRGPAPTLGEHNAEVLRDILGYDESRIEALIEKGVLAAKPA